HAEAFSAARFGSVRSTPDVACRWALSADGGGLALGRLSPGRISGDNSGGKPIAGAKSAWHRRTVEMPVLDRCLTARSIAQMPPSTAVSLDVLDTARYGPHGYRYGPLRGPK